MIQINITDEQRENLLCSAIEGGSNYWYYLGQDACTIVEKYGDSSQTPFVTLMWKAIKAGESIPIRDTEDHKTILGTINIKSIDEGEQIMSDKYPHILADILSDNDDAGTGDIWFQLAVMKEVVYG